MILKQVKRQSFIVKVKTHPVLRLLTRDNFKLCELETEALVHCEDPDHIAKMHSLH